MRLKKQWSEIRSSGTLSATVAALLGLAFLVYGVGRGLTDLSFDLPFAFRPAAQPSEAVIVYMDEDTHRALGQPYLAAWDRGIHAQLLDRLKAASAKTVAFDILFDSTSTNDAPLIRAVAAHGRVVVGARFTPVGVAGLAVWEPRQPFEELRRVAAWGVAEVPDEDDVVRQHQRVARHSTNLVSLAWRTAEVSGAERLPIDFNPRYLNYYGPPGTIPWLSYLDVLSNRLDLAALSNKVVFVGALVRTGFTGGRGTDNYPTPYSRWTGGTSAGVEINATAYLNLVRGDWLRRLSPITEVLVVVGAAVVFGFLFMLLRPVGICFGAASAMVLVFAIACAVVWQTGIWFPWAIVSGVQIPSAAICALVFRAQKLHQDKRALEEQLGSSQQASAIPATAPEPSLGPVALEMPALLMSHNIRQRLETPRLERGGNNDNGTARLEPAGAPPNIPDCTLLRRIGTGAYGEVWLSTNVIGAFRAVKIVHRSTFREDRPYEREFDGIRHFDPVSRNHPGLVHMLQVGRNDSAGYFYYVMELADDAAEGQVFAPERYEPKTLARELQARGRLQAEACLQLGLALANALEYLHEHGLIHRDIKPSNIIFVSGKPKLADIGLVTHIGEGRTFVGTEGFCPPEGPGSPAGDIYSLGKVLYVALTGLRQDQFPDLPRDMPEGDKSKDWKRLNRIVLRACERDPARRYATAAEVRGDLTRIEGKRASPWRRP